MAFRSRFRARGRGRFSRGGRGRFSRRRVIRRGRGALRPLRVGVRM